MSDRQSITDPAVQAILNGQRAKQRQRTMTPAQRRKAQRDGERNKATYDLPRGITDRIAEIAEVEGVPKSGVVAVFLLDAINRYDDRAIDLERFKQPSVSPKYSHVIEIPENKIP